MHVNPRAGALLPASTNGAPWRRGDVAVRNIFVERRADGHPVDSLHVAALADLPESLLVPTELWPTVDLVSTISASNMAPLAGETVRFTIAVTNRGGRPLERAWVRATVDREGAPEMMQDWFQPLGAGETVRLEFAAQLPAGRATVVVTATPARTTETMGGADAHRDPAFLIVGGPTWRRQ